MTFSSSLADDHRPLVLDTSVLVNLHACTYGERVLSAIQNEIVVADIVAGELEHETSRRNGELSFLHDMIRRGKVTIIGMTEAEGNLFARLSGGPSSLDDGEAATVAIATHRGFRTVIDERKGRARAVAMMNGDAPAWSLDLLRHISVIKSLGEKLAADVVYLALRYGRMRIPSECGDDVVALIGRDRALECTCLPNFKSLLQEARSSNEMEAAPSSRNRR
ncbi:MAG: DNA-binding protein [Rhabdaerophilum sp.]